jgi:hypothetical protein
MTHAPMRPCSGQGGRCPALVRGGGKCPACTTQAERLRGNFRQRLGGLYDASWDRASSAFRREYPICGMRPGGKPPVMSRCHEQGIVTPAYQTDHVVPTHERPDLFWDSEGNWQSLCRNCGAAKSRAGL